jgi:short-subunit dehydrogenase
MDDDFVLITGASAGIGEALAREYARRGRALVLLARRNERLQALAHELRSQVPVEILTADLADPAAPAAIQATLSERGIVVGGLVNNAGYGLPGAYHVPDWSAHARFLQVMVSAVCELTWRLLPEMQSRGRGEILNVASLAGLVPPTAGHTLYGPTKAFVIRFSETLAKEVGPKGVHVTALCPGMTYTEFHDVNGMRATVAKLPKGIWLDAATVAKLGVDAVESGRTRLVTGRANRLIAALSKYLPDRLAGALIAAKAKDFRDEG